MKASLKGQAIAAAVAGLVVGGSVALGHKADTSKAPGLAQHECKGGEGCAKKDDKKKEEPKHPKAMG